MSINNIIRFPFVSHEALQRSPSEITAAISHVIVKAWSNGVYVDEEIITRAAALNAEDPDTPFQPEDIKGLWEYALNSAKLIAVQNHMPVPKQSCQSRPSA